MSSDLLIYEDFIRPENETEANEMVNKIRENLFNEGHNHFRIHTIPDLRKAKYHLKKHIYIKACIPIPESSENKKLTIDEFIKEMEIPKHPLVNTWARDIIAQYDVGYCIAIDRLMSVFDSIISARFYFLNSIIPKDYTRSNLLGIEPFADSIDNKIRCQFLKSAILLYNSCPEYIYHTIWFAFNMHQEPYHYNPNWYRKVMKKCSSDIVVSMLTSKAEKNIDARKLLNRINEIRCDTEIDYIRSLSNCIKHKGNLRFKGVDDSREINFMVGFELNDTEKIGFSTHWLNPEVIDLNGIQNIIISLHKKLISYISFIIDFLELSNVFVETKNSSFGDFKYEIHDSIINTNSSIQPKYKKIIFPTNDTEYNNKNYSPQIYYYF
jgi:hypothetical protein